MFYFGTLATSVWRFVSRAPSSTSSQCPPSLSTQCVTSETPPSSSQSTLQNKKALDLLSDRSMSPTTRINNWHIDTDPHKAQHLDTETPSAPSSPSSTQQPVSAGKKRKMFSTKIYPHPHWCHPKRVKLEDLDMESMQVDSDGEDYQPSNSGSDNSDDPDAFAKQIMEDLELNDGEVVAEQVDVSKTAKWLTHYHNTASADDDTGDNKAREAELPDEVIAAVRQSYLEDKEYKEIWERLTKFTNVVEEVEDLKESNYFIGKHGLMCFLDDDNKDFVVVPDHLKSRWPEYFDSESEEESEEMDEDEEEDEDEEDDSEEADEDGDDEEEVEDGEEEEDGDEEDDDMDDSGDFKMDEDEVDGEVDEDDDDEEAEDEEEEAADDKNHATFEDAEEDISSLVDDAEDANESIHVNSSSRPEAFTPHKVAEIEAERQRRLLDVAANAAAGWPAHDLAVYRALHLRGTEPLMPRAWASELPTIPYELFTNDPDVPFLKPLMVGDNAYKDERYGGKHLNEMMPMGPWIRDLDRHISEGNGGNGPQRRMMHYIRHFSRWCMGDANLRRTEKLRPPVLAIMMEKRQMSADDLLKKTIKELEKLEKKWKKKLIDRNLPVPPLYAITSCGLHMCFSSYVPESQRAGPGDHTKLRTLAFFGWDNADYDVWNIFALAILMVHCRNILYEIVMAMGEIDAEVEWSDPDL